MAQTIHINNSGAGFREALDATERLAKEHGVDEKQQARLRLLAEETMEMVRNISGEFEAELGVTINREEFELRMNSKASTDSWDRKRLQEIVEKEEGAGEVTGKIRAILESRYYDESETNTELFEQMGIQRIEEGEEALAGEDTDEAKYVWSLQNYGFKTFDKQLVKSEEDAEWAEIGRSIIANLSDDLRIYIFRDHLEIVVSKLLKDDNEQTGEWQINPEFEMLKKVPVASSRIQVKMVQLLYGGLMKKEKSDETLLVRQIILPCEAAVRHRVNCVVYEKREKEGELLPAVLLLHGGAFVFPALPYHYRLARTIAKETGCRVFMPDYDLAPANKPPRQQKEAFQIYQHLVENAEAYRIDPERIVIVGDSAGGTLCAALSLWVKNEPLPKPAGQLLLYPSLDARLQSRSMKMYTDVPVVNAKAVVKYYELADFSDDLKPREWFSPVEAESLQGMPPTYVETAEFDSLHDDGILYADRISKEHGDVILNETKGTVHAFDMAKDSSILKECMERRIQFIKGVL